MIYRAAGVADVPVVQAMLAELARHEGGSSVGSVAALTEHGFGPRPLFFAVIAEAPAGAARAGAAQPGETRTGEVRVTQSKACGMAIYYPDFSTHRGQPGVYVQDLYVDRSVRGAGVGRGLLAAVMRLQDWGAQYLTLGVSPDNDVALAFYARCGFRARGYRFMILDGAGLEALQ